MSFEQFTGFFDWLHANPYWVGIIVFLTALTESLVIVGLIVPGFILMVGYGALISTGYLDFWHVTLFAAVGAFFGDSLSYWLGKHYQHRLDKVWPLSKHPHLMQKGQAYFERYGVMSVIFGRFFGPLRAIVPAIAGISNMPRGRFLVANALSAAAWAPLYLLPGILFGMSYELAKEFAGQLALLLAVVFVLFLASYIIIKAIYTWIVPQTDVLLYRLLIWSRQHPRSGSISESLVSAQRSEIRALSTLGLILIGATILYFLLTHILFDARLFANLDQLVFTQLQLNQIPLLDNLFVGFMLLGERISIISIYIILLLYFSLTERLKFVLYCLAALVLPWIIANLLDISYLRGVIQPPDSILTDRHEHGLFFIDVSALGFLAVLLGRNAGPAIRSFLYLGIIMICMLIALAQLYFGVQWLSEIIGGLLLGMIWVSLLSIAFRSHTARSNESRHAVFSVTILAMIVVLPFVIARAGYQQQLLPGKYQQQEFVMSKQGWADSGWQVLPGIRRDLNANNNHPFTLQWSDNETNIKDHMKKAGWQIQQNHIKNFVNWFGSVADVQNLPVLPHVHNGKYSRLHFTRPYQNGLMIVRLWHSNYYLQDTTTGVADRIPLWYGTVTLSVVEQNAWLNYLVSDNDFRTPLIKLQQSLQADNTIETRVIKTQQTQPFILLVETGNQKK